MNVTGKLGFDAGKWTVRELSSGKKFTLTGVQFPERSIGLTVRVVGAVADSFGGGIIDDEVTLQVQRWDAV